MPPSPPALSLSFSSLSTLSRVVCQLGGGQISLPPPSNRTDGEKKRAKQSVFESDKQESGAGFAIGASAGDTRTGGVGREPHHACQASEGGRLLQLTTKSTANLKGVARDWPIRQEEERKCFCEEIEKVLSKITCFGMRNVFVESPSPSLT